LPLMLLPYFLFHLKGRSRMLFFGALTLSSIIIMWPIANGVAIFSFMNSADLYFQKFEFNASVYYLMRWVGKILSGYNLIYYIGPMLGLITVLINVKLANRYAKDDFSKFFKYALLVWIVYLLLATTVHPWYVICLLFLGMFTKLRYPYIWSYLIIISYINYSYSVYYENLWWIALEYALLFGFIIFEYFSNTRKTMFTH
ncbi:MAG: hypothetical protein WBO36_01795, partial [Saprospiraceae bacterium]